ncbi:hypothetical protein LCGC14_2541630 [marine sediment metagenome]|uniref:Uncharacterized protein n=1 Tax=marine sediment metagenome TaxID=412755 RepID=A0A0F9AQK3_9ZZZZ
MDIFELLQAHRNDEGIKVGLRHKRVTVADNDILWYEYLSGSREWSMTVGEDVYLEAAFQAGLAQRKENNHAVLPTGAGDG